jgi:hypothetical protein
MRVWERTATPTAACGKCGQVLPAESWVLVITIPGLKSRLLRCATCEGPAPPDLPADAPGPRVPTAPTRLVPTAVVDKWLPYKERE